MILSYFYCLIIPLIVISSEVISTAQSEGTTTHLIVALPLQHGNRSSASWERGKEILSGAENSIDNLDIFEQDRVHVFKVDTRKCSSDNFDYLIQLINSTTKQNISLLGIIGMFCPFRVQLLLQLPLQKDMLKLAVKSAYSRMEWSKLQQESIMVKALLEFFTDLKWRKIGIITETTDNIFFSQLAEELLQYAKSAQTPNIEITVYNYGKTFTVTVGNINLPRIILVSLSAKSVLELLCSVFKKKLMWPKHVWILHSYQLEDFKQQADTSCTPLLALENVLLFREEFLSTSGLYTQHNIYAGWIHDAIWSMSAKVNKTLHNKHLEESSNASTQMQISVTHIRNFNESIVAQYSNKLILIDETFKTRAPSDELGEVYEGGSFVYTFTLAAMICLGFISTSTLLLSFIYFRNEPEIKSTSFSLCLLVFLGCYLTLMYLSLNLHLHQPSPSEKLSVLCFSLHLLSGLGIPGALILATLIIKMLRIYYIFTKHTPKKLSQVWSDSFLLLYIMLILSPMILLYIIWAFVDPYTGFLQHSADLNVITVEKGCTSVHLTVWQSLLVLYILTLFLILLVIAIMMRNIQYEHFKDTKKINVLILCLFLDLLLTLVTWRVLYTIIKIRIADILMHFGHHMLIILCQAFLFAPKIFPPFVRSVRKRTARNAETETADS